MERVMRNKTAVFFFLLPSFVLFAAIVIVPIFMSFEYSLTEWDGIQNQIFVGLANYKTILTDPIFLTAMRNSFLFAAASVCIQLPLSLLLALILSSRVKGERFFVTVYFIPVILASVVIGQLWSRIYQMDHGILNVFLRSIGADSLARIDWLGNKAYALGAVMVPVLWQYVGYHMLLFYSGINSISPDIFEAAKIDGASFWRTSTRITIPLLRPIIAVSVTFAVTGAMKVYDLVRVMTDGGPVGRTEVITTRLVKTMFYPGRDYGVGSAMAIVLIVECFVLYLVVSRMLGERRERRARKGD